MPRKDISAEESTQKKSVNCSPEEFFRRIESYDDPSGLLVYVYRLWPVIDRSLAGVEYKHIYATPPPFTLDHLIKQCGSGKYRLILVDEHLGKNSKVAQCMVSINDPDWPPVVNPKELIMEHPDNRAYIESLRMRGLLEREDTAPASDGAAAVAVESLSRTVADLASRMSERSGKDDPDKSLSLALRLAELVKPGKDPVELATQIAGLIKRDDSAVLLKALLEQQTKLTELVVQQQQRNNPGTDLEQIERLLKIADRLGKGGGSGESWGLELVRSLPATLAAAADLMRTVAAAKAGQVVPEAAPGAAPAPAASSSVVPTAPNPGPISMDRLVYVGQKAVVAFQRGATGDDFAHALVVTEPDGEVIYDQLAALGKDGIMASLRVLPVWGQLEARAADIERFVDEFLAYGQPEGEGGVA